MTLKSLYPRARPSFESERLFSDLGTMAMPELRLREIRRGLEVIVYVQPRARRCGLAGLHNGALKLKVIAPPVGGLANRAVLEFFSALLHLPKSRLQIVTGETSREKTLRIEGIS